ncbi:DNA mismatch repair endonuclease MutL [Aeromonas dhakensis]|uniref:DNA mismatch repair endonuclease MutL n=1 Tax=Aeromonas TaxID=642 RepID=UPI000E3C3C19|nr:MULTISPECIES: DNA mismatch repair endonuclease MutL [Aeromonas]MDD9309111.1 DNA mismatch repair endonuclease MutL [Aeromonas hydrophila]MBL0463274.1 DNA mismatch repair endonuclease MutL [Aeromonas dhakensis]MBL0602517.1 DNA mismatch repair endonuclease MutL [Aeromonas dhakensis]MBL0618995.1 DNA mismatch repair endonuclease MutL [Aeromonas dhakensis]MBL0658707.1 DNA mismatch repair endonuclease MutL [Aeromonas dhakensis]
MPIRILPPILANQIAAGEVVERPSSVVKELVENSLDAGADRVEIDIDKGGAKLIRIRDNGGGVAKDELVLALSRHATSKVATLDDLEGINSLGFRGEALASISSVSRLTFTSRTAEQSEAWQAQAEGREMSVTVKPAAHPVGTTVEVVDLFFNTPARRKFMRSEKTEFAHIDELVRRIALSRFDVTLILRHNGKVVRQYKAANTVAEQERRLAAVCGSPFMHHALAVESEHSDVRLWGWLATPAGARPQNDLQYTYVNGRMMRDKLINHAIRQAYDELLPTDRFAAYVLYIELDPRQVDVNVHPAKHEVRFHQARLIHDFIFQALFTALRQPGAASDESDQPLAETLVELPVSAPIEYPGQAPRAEWYGAEHNYRAPAREVREGSGAGRPGNYQPPEPPSREAMRGMGALLTTLPTVQDTPLAETETAPAAVAAKAGAWRALTLVEQAYLLLERDNRLALLSLVRAERLLLRHWLLETWGQGLAAQPLLLPVSFKLPKNLVALVETQERLLKRMGLELKSGGRDTMILTRVPALLRQTDLVRLLPELLQLIESGSDSDAGQQAEVLCQWLVEQGISREKVYDFATANRLLTELVADFSDQLADVRMVRPLSLASVLAEFADGH